MLISYLPGTTPPLLTSWPANQAHPLSPLASFVRIHHLHVLHHVPLHGLEALASIRAQLSQEAYLAVRLLSHHLAIWATLSRARSSSGPDPLSCAPDLVRAEPTRTDTLVRSCRATLGERGGGRGRMRRLSSESEPARPMEGVSRELILGLLLMLIPCSCLDFVRITLPLTPGRRSCFMSRADPVCPTYLSRPHRQSHAGSSAVALSLCSTAFSPSPLITHTHPCPLISSSSRPPPS
jgi:hypothetical protein